jgi:formyltetrahydrofolate deformylase
MTPSAVLLVSCPDARGEVAAISDFVYRHGGNILHADEHADADSGLFLMRVEFDPKDFDIDLLQSNTAQPTHINPVQSDRSDFASLFSPIAEKFHMTWRLSLSSDRPRMIVFVSKYDHCLVDLLYRQQSGELACEIPLIISNHADNQRIADFYKIPYAVISMTKENKEEAEQKIESLIQEHKADFLVLARYMQIFSSDFVKRYPQRIINIHHGFLPAFIGAKPYHQAFERGVKLIGATSHYVTEVLDDGPIIEQDVVRVSHRDTVEDLIRKGRDLEKVVLSRAVRWHVENRVLLYGNKTVVF